jgi:hypothetical protein
MQTNFLLGTIQITPEATRVLKRLPLDLVARHAVNDHGRITGAERRKNESGMKTVGSIRSRYRADPTSARSEYVVIETDAGWGSTLIYLE